MRLGGRAWLAILLAVALAGCGRGAPACGEIAAREATPPLWRVSGGAGTLYLLGSVHVLSSAVRWQTPAVARAVAAADTLVTEIPDDANATAAAFAALSPARGLPAVAERLPVNDRGLLALVPDAGDLDALKSWAAAIRIGQAAQLRHDGYGDSGVEAVLARRFAAAGKRHLALETARDQFAALDAMGEEDQRRLLAESARALACSSRDFDTTLAAWASGDDAALRRDAEGSLAGSPGSRAALVDRRNARWADLLAARLRKPGVTLVAVGAGHLVGPGSLPDLLHARGFRVARLR